MKTLLLWCLFKEMFPSDVTKLRNDIRFDPMPDDKKNSSSVGQLLLDFFRYYTHQFKWVLYSTSIWWVFLLIHEFVCFRKLSLSCYFKQLLLIAFSHFDILYFSFERTVASVRTGSLISLEEAIRYEYDHPNPNGGRRRGPNRNSWLTAHLYVEGKI